MSQVCMASVYAFGKLQRSSPGQQTSPCSVCFITGSNFLCGVDLTSITAKTLHDSDQELIQFELRCEYIKCHPRVGRVVLRTSCFERALSVALLCRIPPPYWALSYLRWWARCTRPNRLDQCTWHPSQCHCYDLITLVAWFAVAATLLDNPSRHLSELEVLLLNACCLHNRWMIDPLRNCTQSPNLPDVS